MKRSEQPALTDGLCQTVACGALQGRGYGYAAIHGCTGDIVKFVFNGTDTHNLVEIASQPQGARLSPTCCPDTNSVVLGFCNLGPPEGHAATHSTCCAIPHAWY